MTRGTAWPVLRSCALAATLSAGGCSTTPLVLPWPGSDPVVAGASMPGALGYLDAVRVGYRNGVATQLNDERAASNALLGTGALIAALALGKVHRDAIIGTAFLGGTGYAFSQSNLQRPRLLIYQAGVEALNCAERAVTPFAISKDEQDSLTGSLRKLERSRQALVVAMAEVQRAVNTLKDDIDLPAAQATLSTARVQLADSEKTLRAGSAFNASVTRGARDLVAAVNGIDAAVTRSLANATPDLSNVPKLVSGLAGMVGAFAPGAGVDELMMARMAAVNAAGGAPRSGAKAESAVVIATEALVAAIIANQAANADTAARLAGRIGPFPDDAFKDCGVAQVVSALNVSPQRLNFTAGVNDKRVIDISGGIKPYFVEIEGPASKALTAKGPIRFDTRSELTFDGSAASGAAEGTLRVSDSAPNAPTIVLVPITVAASAPNGDVNNKVDPASSDKKGLAKKNVPAPQPKPGASGGDASALDAAVAALKAKAQFKLGGKDYMRSDLPVKQGGTIQFTVVCPADAAPVKRIELARAYLTEAGVTTVAPEKVVITTQPASCAAP